jgi:hypothetical protein
MRGGDMKSIKAHEFRDHVSKYLDADETLSIEEHGRTIGYFIPARGEPTVAERRARLKKALDGLAKISEEIQQRTGLTEDEVADLFDYKKPLPDVIPIREPSPAPHVADAPGD